ncbi:MAG: 4-phosphopantoate--beta-alanine ligase [Candidatus Natronoplasma sp.]
MVEIPQSHPRYLSLKMREVLVEGVEEGITSKAGLIAHGRGEMFDYLIGEESIKTAKMAERKAIAKMMEAENPVISINGNVAALVPEEIVELGKRLDAKLEVNLFHRTNERISKIKRFLELNGAEKVYGLDPEEEIPGLDHKRALCSHDGIYTSDVVLVPLEDGDRAQALNEMGKTVITIDLNPLSRTSKAADITIVDNVVRAVPNMLELEPLYEEFDNAENLKETLLFMSKRLKTLSEEI